ncbi:TetR/AcrR family transcriptional regulator [Bhargavaea ginsengi]|uniref:TetR/AcrR family transcriptional regulator n=1 Tax=Bhargavaea ginsengi TaxID=426757 RepID=UPI00203FBC01|nr:TetR/AcrR family transcriptional regulator [Bhargavaea ginsengi]MCM3086958.1 TetR/AcrR family transcriptional regulator [Bhargavaea ginsengi]
MKESFRRLESNRQQEILKAAMQEFAENGFGKASTNRIVKNAGMSKGMLYYYFINKEDLFLDCIGYALEHMEQSLEDWIGTGKEGFIERMARIAESKRIYFRQHPEISAFAAVIFLSPEVPPFFKERLEALMEEGTRKMFDGLDLSRFRGDLPPETLMRLVQWTFDGYAREAEERMRAEGVDTKDMDRYWDEFDMYLEAMKTIYYKGDRS